MTDILAVALESLKNNISTLPPKQDGTKAPDSLAWKQYQIRLPTVDEVKSWYSAKRTGVGWVTGQVSGGLEAIDFDDRSAYAEFVNLCDQVGLRPLFDKVANGYLEHTPNGAHLIYRCAEIGGSQKLAMRKGGKAKIETKGEGGYIIVAPTYGSVNPGGAYELRSGGPAKIKTITPAERKSLLDLARTLDEQPAKVQPKPSASIVGLDGQPGDDYNQRATWADVLEPHGWRQVFSRSGVVYWRRPGKKFGISATTNHAGSDLLYVFSTSTVFGSEIGYSKFGAYALLNFSEDFVAAASELRLLGYGSEKPSASVDLSVLLRKLRGEDTFRERAKIEDLLHVPGLVGELADWINRSSVKKQPILALGASIAAVSTILGRKVQTETGLRSNVYILGVGETGCGKEQARQCIKLLYTELGKICMVGESFASDAAVETAVMANPACLYLIDELGHFLGTVRNEQTPSYVKAIVPILMKMYSSSESVYRRRTYADAEMNKETFIDQPCLSLYGTTVPRHLYRSLSKDHLSDGLLSRLLVFESADRNPQAVMIDLDQRIVPAGLVAGFRRWLDYDLGGNLSGVHPRPVVVHSTRAAKGVFAELEKRVHLKIDELLACGEEHGPYTRLWATAQKLALIRACGLKPEPEITESDAIWGCDLAMLLTAEFIDRVDGSLCENKFESDSKRVLDVIRANCGMDGLSRSDLTRKTQWLKRMERHEILLSLCESGRVLELGEGKGRLYKA